MGQDGNLEERVERWIRGLERDIEVGEYDLEDLGSYLDRELDDAQTMSSTDPAGAYGKVMKLANSTGVMARKKPMLVELLGKYVKRFVDVMNEIKKALGALSFTITVSFPFDMSLSLTF